MSNNRQLRSTPVRTMSSEIIFVVKESPEGGFEAQALGESIYTETESSEEVHRMVRDAVECHYDEDKRPRMIRLHFVREEVIST